MPKVVVKKDDDAFNLEHIASTLNHMAIGKACDIIGLYVEMLKWAPKQGFLYIKYVITKAHKEEIPI